MKAKKIIALLASVSLLLVAVLVPMMSASADDESGNVASSSIYGTDEKVLESFNEVESQNNIWNNRTVRTDIEDVHGGAIHVNGSDGTAALTTAWDMTGYMDGKHAFKLRIYAAENYIWPVKKDGTSNGANWNIYFGNNTANTDVTDIDQMPRIGYGKRFYLKAGWNEVYLPITKEYVYSGSLSELGKITHVRMFDTGASDGGAVYLDEIAVVSYTPVDPVYDAVKRVLYLDSMDDPAPYLQNTGEVQFNTNCQEGLGSLSIGGGHIWLKRDYATVGNAHVDTTNGAVKFELYLSAPENLSNLWFVLESGGGESKGGGKIQWNMEKFDLTKSGWQEVELKFNDASVINNFDATKVSFSHIEMDTKSNTATLLGMDNLRIINTDGACKHTNQTLKTEQVNADCGRAGTKAIFTCDDCQTELGGETIDATGEHDDDYTNTGVCGVCGTPNPDYREPGVYYVDVDGPTAGVVDQEVEVKVDVICAGEDQFAAGQMTINYDSDKLEYVGITGRSGSKITVNDKTAGTLKISDYGEDKALGDAVYTITFEAIADGEATITLDAAAFSNKKNAETLDLSAATVADGDNNSVTVTIRKANHAVTLPSEGFTGNSEVKDGADYTFSWTTDGAHYDYSEVTATMGGVDVPVIDNGNGTYTIKTVTGALVITATREAKVFDVTITGDTVSNNGETATYGTAYSFTIPENLPAGQEAGYSYAMTGITIGGTNYTGYETSADGRTFTIPGTAVTGDIAITITKTDLAANQFTVTVTGSGAGQITVSKGENTLASGAVVGLNDKVTVNLDKAEGYVYTVTVDGTAVTVFPHEITVAANVNIVAERAIDTSTVDVDTYLDLDEATMWLITIGNKQITGKTYTYNGVNMFWSEEYGAYCTLVVGTGSELTPTAAEFTIADDVAAETVVYDMDVNKSTEVDTNDAQLVYNMYNAEYSGFTTNVTMEKFLRADVNGDKTVDVEDAAAIVAHVLSLNANA